MPGHEDEPNQRCALLIERRARFQRTCRHAGGRGYPTRGTQRAQCRDGSFGTGPGCLAPGL